MQREFQGAAISGGGGRDIGGWCVPGVAARGVLTVQSCVANALAQRRAGNPPANKDDDDRRIRCSRKLDLGLLGEYSPFSAYVVLEIDTPARSQRPHLSKAWRKAVVNRNSRSGPVQPAVGYIGSDAESTATVWKRPTPITYRPWTWVGGPSSIWIRRRAAAMASGLQEGSAGQPYNETARRKSFLFSTKDLCSAVRRRDQISSSPHPFHGCHALDVLSQLGSIEIDRDLDQAANRLYREDRMRFII